MNNHIKYSIVIPVYNVEKYLKYCLDSVLHQTYLLDTECILVDDGSSDDSGVICDEYAKKYDFFISYHKPNGGLVSARKFGAIVSRGEYIIPIDADDLISEDYLSYTNQIACEYNPDIISYTRYYRYYCDKKLSDLEVFSYGINNGYYDERDIDSILFPIFFKKKNGKKFHNTAWQKIVKRDLYLKSQLTIDDRISLFEDFCLSYMLFQNAKSVYFSDKLNYFYRYDNISMVRNNKKTIDTLIPVINFLNTNIKFNKDICINDYHIMMINNIYDYILLQYRFDTIKSIYKIQQLLEKKPFSIIIEKVGILKMLIKGFSIKEIIKTLTIKYKLFFIIKLNAFLRNNFVRENTR